ncbi:MAG TPA: ferritin family protein [Nitrospirota bacterium]
MDDISVKEILDYAKINEDNARMFYLQAAEHASLENVRAFLLSLAKEEQRHLEKLTELERIIERGEPIPAPSDLVKPLGYAEYLGEIKIDADANYQEILRAAMAKEREALESYKKYFNLVDNNKAKDLFLLLANEESRHLRHFEERFDDFMREIEE